MKFKFRSRIYLYLLLLLGLFVASQATIYTVVEWAHRHANPYESMQEGMEEVVQGVGLTLLLVPFLAGVAWFLSQRMIGPLRAVAATAQRIRKGRWDERIETGTMPDDETRSLAETVNAAFDGYAGALRRLERFSGDAAHQLRTPIAALQAQVEATLAESAPQLRQQLQGILAAAHRLSHLVEQMLMLARAQPSLARTQPPVALGEVAQAAAEDWLPVAIANGIDLGFELAPCTVSGNSFLLQEVFSNLLDNALRHTPHGGSVTVRCGADDDGAWLAVEDSGPGIAEADREKVFERFYQSLGGGSRGSGLGLAIVREIARQHGGHAAIDRSPELGGARVTVRFTLA